MSESIRAKKWGRKNGSGSSSGTPTKRKSYALDVNDDRPARTPTRKRYQPTYDEKKLKDLALFYCAKRETSRPKLQAYLSRKVDLNAQPEARDWIEKIIVEFERLQVIDHARYAGMINREYARRGKGKRYIQQKLNERGVAEQVKGIEFDSEDELTRATQEAIKLLQKSTIRKIEDPYQRKQKLLMKVVTLGFEFDVAKKAVEVALKKE